MVEYQLFNHNDAIKILQQKGLFNDIISAIQNVKRRNHREIQAELYNKGWKMEQKIFPEVTWAWDAYKDKVAASIELSLIDAVHRDFLRAILAHKRDYIHALLYITSTSREPKFQNVKRDITIFKDLLNFPILLIGLK